MIVITGAAGFIGSCLVSYLNKQNHKDLIIVDDFSISKKNRNLEGKHYHEKVDRNEFFNWAKEQENIDFIFHLGARTDTTEMDKSIFDKLNLQYSKQMWTLCCEKNIPLVYASSAATYGSGEHGYDDNHEIIFALKPLNPYGESKNDFDIWALQQEISPVFWCGLKFFNVYGPNEYHKGRMASVVMHAFNQIQNNGMVKLFASHNPNYENGMQLRDFVYVKDVVKVCYFFMQHRDNNGLYNLGTGKADTFYQLAMSTFAALGVEAKIEFIPTPEDIRDKYQYFTEANMSKLKSIGYSDSFHSLDEGAKDYVKNYLQRGDYY